jgi:hypothetical protein
MSAPDRQAEIASLVPIPWWPGKQRLAAVIRRSRLTLSNTEGELVEGVTLYRNWSLHEPRWVKEGCGDYVFSEIQGGVGSDVSVFLFNPPVPVPEGGGFAQLLIEDDYTSDGYPWPPILADLLMLLDVSKIRQQGLTLDFNAAVDRGLWRNGQNVPSLVRTRIYVSNAKPPKSLVRTAVPLPTEIRGDYFGQPVRIPPCLHAEVTLESVNSDDAVIYDAMPSRASMRTGNRLTYRATNYTSWAKHIFFNQVTKQDGLYRRVVREVEPPSMPPLSYT